MTDTGTVVADPYGDEWCTYAAALEQVPGLKASTLRGWVHSGKVRTLPRNDTPRGVLVCLTDTLALVRDARRAGWRPGPRPKPQEDA